MDQKHLSPETFNSLIVQHSSVHWFATSIIPEVVECLPVDDHKEQEKIPYELHQSEVLLISQMIENLCYIHKMLLPRIPACTTKAIRIMNHKTCHIIVKHCRLNLINKCFDFPGYNHIRICSGYASPKWCSCSWWRGGECTLITWWFNNHWY